MVILKPYRQQHSCEENGKSGLIHQRDEKSSTLLSPIIPWQEKNFGRRERGDLKTKNEDDDGVFHKFISEIMFFTLIKI